MAIKNIYSVMDTELGAFLNPIVFTTDAEAIRWFTTTVNGDKEQTNIARYPQQFMLFKIGEMDDKTGMFDKDYVPKELIIGTACKEVEEQYTIKKLMEYLEDYFKNKGVTH
jgi:hypothetical protein